jgi:phenylpropionate dioxygenase-like ring-hydroxylating dioxygenase large terminal subunit
MFVHAHRLRHLLRPEHYTSAAHHDRELAHLFRPAWHPVTTVDRLARPGDFLTAELFGQPLLLRNMGGELCCFLNVCAHRHCRLVSLEHGHSPELRCQYHGWEYNQEGRTGRIPDAQSFRPWDRDNACLRKFRVETWGDLVFVCLEPPSPSLAAFLAPLTESWGAAFAPPFRLAGAWHLDFACNWRWSWRTPWSRTTSPSSIPRRSATCLRRPPAPTISTSATRRSARRAPAAGSFTGRSGRRGGR